MESKNQINSQKMDMSISTNIFLKIFIFILQTFAQNVFETFQVLTPRTIIKIII